MRVLEAMQTVIVPRSSVGCLRTCLGFVVQPQLAGDLEQVPYASWALGSSLMVSGFFSLNTVPDAW